MVAPRPGRWRHEFPYVAGVAALAHPITIRVLDGGTTTESFELNTAERLRKALYHPDSGIITNNMNGVLFYVARGVYDGWADELDGTPYIVLQGIDVDVDGYTALNDASATQETLDTTIHTGIDPHANHPSTIAYIFRDDASVTAGDYAERVSELMLRIPELDPARRPASPAFLSGDEFINPDALNSVFLAGAGRYASRYQALGVKRTEGDFAIGTNFDWSDAIRDYVTDHPNAHVWWWCQAHQLGDGTNLPADLSYPTGAEIRKQVWEAIGAGVKGIAWFILQDDFDNTWEGLASPDSAERMAAVADMGSRLTPEIRRRLLSSSPVVSPPFTVSGGGSGGAWFNANFATANLLVKQDDHTDEYMCVVVNRSTADADITISSATLNGHLINLETGDSHALGQAISFSPLEGRIFRFNDMRDDRIVPIDFQEGVEEYWDRHWANPASSSYIAINDITTHAKQVVVTPETIVELTGAAVETSPGVWQTNKEFQPGPTTWVMAPGSYPPLKYFNKSHYHFVAQDPLNKPEVQSFFVYPHGNWMDYHGKADGSIVQMLRVDRNADRLAEWNNLPRDWIFRDLIFQGGKIRVGQIANTWDGFEGENFGTIPDPTATHGIPIHTAGLREVLIEGCTFKDYIWPSFDVDQPSIAERYDAAMQGQHAGQINAGLKCEHWVIRGCDFQCANNPFSGLSAMPNHITFDGAHGIVIQGNTFTGRTTGNYVLALTNQDVTFDVARDGRFTRDDIRTTAFMVIHGNTFAPTQGTAGVGSRWQDVLIAENTWTFSGNWTGIVGLEANGAPEYFPGGSLYNMYGAMKHEQFNIIFRNNDINNNGTINYLVGASARTNDGAANPTSPYRSEAGKITIINNTFTSLPTEWIHDVGLDDGGPAITGPHLISGNTDGINAGVPHVLPVATMTTDEWWDSVWFNPASNNYVAYGDIVVHANQVTVAPGNLQAALDAEPDDTTFLLEAGVHTTVNTIARQGTHLIPADPLNRPTMRSFNYFGHADVAAGRPTFVTSVVTNNEPSAVAAYLDPPGDVLIRDIDFVQEPGVLSTFDPITDNIYNFPIVLWCIADWAVEGCTFAGYHCADVNGEEIQNPDHHHGFISGGAGMHNGVMRNCTGYPTLRANGLKAWSNAMYLDGAAGCGLVYNHFSGHPFQKALCHLLTNDDYAPTTDTAYDGIAGFDEINGEIPNSRYNAVVGNTGENGGHTFVSYMGRNLLHADNVCPLNAAVQSFVGITARSPSHTPTMDGYFNLDNISRNNTYTDGSCNDRYLAHDFGTNNQYDLGARIGRTTITGISFPDGAVTLWHEQSGPGIVTEPLVVTNNTDINGSRDGV